MSTVYKSHYLCQLNGPKNEIELFVKVALISSTELYTIPYKFVNPDLEWFCVKVEVQKQFTYIKMDSMS